MTRIFLCIVILLSTLGCENISATNKPHISVYHGKHSDYYHIKYTLTKNNFTTANNIDPNYNGQFEILLNKNTFPIPANNCKKILTLRMPATLRDSKNRIKSIQTKILLFNKIQSVADGKINSLDVIIELNPYVIIKSKEPLDLELENCNIFFRTKNNNYIGIM